MALAALNVVLLTRGPLSGEAIAAIVTLDVTYVPVLFEIVTFTWEHSAPAGLSRSHKPSTDDVRCFNP